MSKPITVVIPFFKDTTNTFHFALNKNVSADVDVTAIYVKQRAFAGGPTPKSVTVTVTPNY